MFPVKTGRNLKTHTMDKENLIRVCRKLVFLVIGESVFISVTTNQCISNAINLIAKPPVSTADIVIEVLTALLIVAGFISTAIWGWLLIARRIRQIVSTARPSNAKDDQKRKFQEVKGIISTDSEPGVASILAGKSETSKPRAFDSTSSKSQIGKDQARYAALDLHPAVCLNSKGKEQTRTPQAEVDVICPNEEDRAKWQSVIEKAVLSQMEKGDAKSSCVKVSIFIAEKEKKGTKPQLNETVCEIEDAKSPRGDDASCQI